ncbi:IPExxxVDY family protein [Yeosuana marina]|uniref:IPExxxVDY family protein n=1 Tax=Yeosuana marina TaxID=1565536 RepID=UPI0030ECB033|tara:strand:- start:679 stop:1164 length:486 start_codon:yes stop_codon:yes gene_type:complete
MAVHKLILDDVFEESVCTLIAIHCTIEDYRLAYLLNQNLGINLVKNKKDLDYDNGKSTYSIYNWEDKKQLLTWNLVSNICKTNDVMTTSSGLLFETTHSITKTFNLIPELKSVNYLLKIDDELHITKEKYIINTIIRIPQIATAYTIDISQLKSKENLIFS